MECLMFQISHRRIASLEVWKSGGMMPFAVEINNEIVLNIL